MRSQALESITTKRFHCEGGAVYTAGLADPGPALAAIVALQTISDYLDSVCDRGSSVSGEDFRQLHRAMVDAVSLDPPCGDYYALHPEFEDGRYLSDLVARCRQALQAWYEPYRQPDLAWWEFAAACGSTLGIFALFRRATAGTPSAAEIDAIRLAYFPAICSLHILLDYYIDQVEDAKHDEINLVSYYVDDSQRIGRLIHFVERAHDAARSLPDAAFHQWVVGGLPGLYLADPKARQQGLGYWPVLGAGGPWSWTVYQLTRARNGIGR